MALLHSFQYEQAEKSFARVAENDPACAIAYWGEAMSLWHELWDHPDAATLQQGWSDVQKAASIGAPTARERAYIAATAAFYQNDPKLDYAARAAAYSKAMEQVYRRYPDDGEAAAFYGLSLIALPAANPRQDLAHRRQAITILDRLFAAEPDHPGAAHYLIHACDTPQLAPLGLPAARRYARIAPSSPHALHMPSHIFTRLGLWPESIRSNLASAAAAEKLTARHLDGASYQLHAMDFLNYAYLQSGREAEARRVIDELKSVPGASRRQIAWNEATLQARTAIELHHWREAAALRVPPGAPGGGEQAIDWARSIGAARSGDLTAARKHVEQLQEAHRRATGTMKQEGYPLHAGQPVDELEAQAWLAYAEGKPEEALGRMRAAADQEDAEGVDSLTVPAREMLGDLLLELKRPGEALTAYRAALAEAPSRFDSLYGAARAAELAGRAGEAKLFYARLAAVAHPGESGRPELREAQAFLAGR